MLTDDRSSIRRVKIPRSNSGGRRHTHDLREKSYTYRYNIFCGQ